MAIELIDKIKQKNNGSFYLVDAIDVEYSGGGDVDTALKRLFNTVSSGGSGEGGSCTVYAGKEEPIGGYEVWIDTNNAITEAEEPSNPILEEFRNIFLTLQSRITKLEENNILLKAEIEALKQGIIPPSSNETTVTGAILLPDGTPLLFDDGSYALYPHGSIFSEGGIKDIKVSGAFLLDNESPLLLSDNHYLLYHNGKIKE